MFRAGPFDLLCSYTQNTLVNKQTLRCEWIYSSSQSYFGQVEQLTIILLSFIDNNSIYSNDASIDIWNVSWWWFMEMGAWARVQFMGYMQSSPKEAPGHAKNTLFPGKKKKPLTYLVVMTLFPGKTTGILTWSFLVVLCVYQLNYTLARSSYSLHIYSITSAIWVFIASVRSGVRSLKSVPWHMPILWFCVKY